MLRRPLYSRDNVRRHNRRQGGALAEEPPPALAAAANSICGEDADGAGDEILHQPLLKTGERNSVPMKKQQ